MCNSTPMAQNSNDICAYIPNCTLTRQDLLSNIGRSLKRMIPAHYPAALGDLGQVGSEFIFFNDEKVVFIRLTHPQGCKIAA